MQVVRCGKVEYMVTGVRETRHQCNMELSSYYMERNKINI